MGLLFRFRKYALKMSIDDEYQGISLSNSSFNKEINENFIPYAKRALAFIEESDPRRFRRVQSEIAFLSNMRLDSVGNYERDLKCCNIDFVRLVEGWGQVGEECLIAFLACGIVHEATHGRIHSYGISYGKENWLRIERLCNREEYYFAKRLKDYCWRIETLVTPIDEEHYNTFFSQSRWQRAKAHFTRLWQDHRVNKRKE